MEQTFKDLSRILTLKTDQISQYKYQYQGTAEVSLEKFLVAFINKQNIEDQNEIYSRFLNYMSEQRHCKLNPQFFNDLNGVKVISCPQCKPYFFQSESRAYCLYGKTVSALRRKTKEFETERPYLCSQLQNAMFHLKQEGNLIIPKNQSHEIQDILLDFTCLDDTMDPVLLSNEVYSPFIPQTYALVLVLPIPMPRPDHMMNFLKSTLLHIYMQQSNLMNKIAYRQIFYKNSLIKGIYFIEQGQVESTGGRVVARGWVTNGKCKSQGYGWKFKPLPFLKSVAKNEHIWKQFLNDLTLNKEYPFQLSYLLGIKQELQVYEAPDKRGRRGVKLPRIAHRSFDYGKLTQMQKVKHYDDRINELCDYKQKLLVRKSGSLNKDVTKISDSANYRSKQKLLIKNESKGANMLKYQSSSLTSSSQNILIMSVLKKLESLTEPRTYYQEDYREKKDKIKISPAKLYQKSRIMKKKRYNQ